jgi:hypothetical protein
MCDCRIDSNGTVFDHHASIFTHSVTTHPALLIDPHNLQNLLNKHHPLLYAVHFAQVLNGHRHERKCHWKNKNVTGRIIMSPEE